MLVKRTNVLLTETDYSILAKLSSERDETMGELIRQAIRKMYNIELVRNTRKKSLSKIDRLARKVKGRGIDYKSLIEDGRRY